ncbi:MAG TPA: Asp-tRNA(Asn)/Glu-tRNA(Gln) amidotransferase subunit GatC [Planctomycetaceae bacterium]|nr:Asp-tRNA(Asn)/Glu-tRNA(Gln) amidotransferase subunit GatC [Planctomycetaceae bacterium]
MDAAEVRKVAKLARLSLRDDELAESGKQLTVILDYVGLLNEVDTTDVAPMSHPIPAENVFRDDDETASLPRDAALANAPKTDGQFFLVPKILEEKGA